MIRLSTVFSKLIFMIDLFQMEVEMKESKQHKYCHAGEGLFLE